MSTANATLSPKVGYREHGFIDGLAKEARQHRAVNHPYLAALKSGALPDPRRAVLDLTHQYLAYSASFPRYLTATISQLEDPRHRRELLANLAEESGVVSAEHAAELTAARIPIEWVDRVPHPQLYKRFLAAAGMDDAWLALHPFSDEAAMWGVLFLQCCRLGPAHAIGALGLGTELIVRQVYVPVLEAIERCVPVAPVDRVFFDLHCRIDDAHGAILCDVADELAAQPNERVNLRAGMLMALQLRAAFYDHMAMRAQQMIPVAAEGDQS